VYDQIAKNKRKSVLLIFLVLVIAVGLGYLFGYLWGFGWGGAAIAFVIAAVMAFSSYRFGDRVVLRVSKAKPASREEYTQLHNIVEGVSIGAGIPKPEVYVIPERAPNAFATGRDPEHSSIAVTEGLLDLLNRVELEGVIAHELAHIRNRDILVGTLTATLVGSVVLIAEFMRRSFLWGGRIGSDSEGKGGALIAAIAFGAALVLSILAPIGAQLIRLAVSRRREYLADADGALITRYPPGLQSALRKIGANPQPMRTTNNATAHLWFSKPSFTPGSVYTLWERLFSTHPPIEDRIKVLEDM
jgi:heat shock protein HtpX